MLKLTYHVLKTAVLLSIILEITGCNTYPFNYYSKPLEYMIPLTQGYTKIDQVVDPLVKDHPNQTGLALLDNNLDAFAVRAMTARSAGRSLDLQYYIWHNDLTGNLLGYELLRAADRGVRVRLLLDDLNAHDKDSMLAALEQHPNIEVRLFNPSYNRSSKILRGLEMVYRGLSLNHRMHNKAWIVDGQIAIVGGRNIGNEYFDVTSQTNFFDVDLLLAGKAALETETIFDTFWNSPATVSLTDLIKIKAGSLEALRQQMRTLDHSTIQETNVYLKQLRYAKSIDQIIHNQYPLYWTDNAHVYSDPPEKAYGQNEQCWLVHRLTPIWSHAQKELRLISPYFVPGKSGLAALTHLRQENVTVGVLTNSLAATDVMMVHSGYAPYRIPLLKEGVNLYELMPRNIVKKKMFGSSGASLHTKAFLVDNKISFVGSFNLDPRSARLNTEMGVLFEQPDITKALIELYGNEIEKDNSYQLFLYRNRLYWQDGSVEPPKIWTHEPEIGLFKRGVTLVMGWLPIESQL